MKKGVALAAYGLAQTQGAVAEYVWPSQYDYLEDLFSLQDGYVRKGFSDEVTPCAFGTNIEGRQNAAEWIRTAYHDMATADVAAGTGGLDASIAFELDRPENVGGAFNNTLGFTEGFHTIRSSTADLIALAVVSASSHCNGPTIPFRVGRIDAVEAGPAGVPEPDQDVDTFREKFARQGFNESDMIALVACGHTLGGVHGENFPSITGNASTGQVTRFDHTFAAFDPAVVTEYLDGDTENPLLVGGNATLQSDRRVFAADGNVTMRSLTDPAVFQARCADVLTRMIDTVPKGVTLTEPMEPADVKPYITLMALNSNGTVDFQGRIRVRVSGNTGRSVDDLAVHLTFADRDGKNSSTIIETTHPLFKLGMSSGMFGEEFSWYEFSTVLDPSTGISRFNVHITAPSTGATSVSDNAGNGFPVQDTVLYQQPQSCMNTTTVDHSFETTVTAAVRKEHADKDLTMQYVFKKLQQGVLPALLEVKSMAVQKTEKTVGDYVLFKVNWPLDIDSWTTTFDLILGNGTDATKVEFQQTNVLAGEVCQDL